MLKYLEYPTFQGTRYQQAETGTRRRQALNNRNLIPVKQIYHVTEPVYTTYYQYWETRQHVVSNTLIILIIGHFSIKMANKSLRFGGLLIIVGKCNRKLNIGISLKLRKK